ncbi:hypothetical protein OAF28_02130, partial [Akkermansiaceae bacterium]|nr:hypothetical protein [Akkermansiaceae bacterium]
QDLIQIPSVNPDGDPGVSPGGEKEVADLVSEFLKPYGFDSVFEEVEPGRPNLIAQAPGSRNRPRILLGPHLDTVGVSGMTIDPFFLAQSVTAKFMDGELPIPKGQWRQCCGVFAKTPTF